MLRQQLRPWHRHAARCRGGRRLQRSGTNAESYRHTHSADCGAEAEAEGAEVLQYAYRRGEERREVQRLGQEPEMGLHLHATGGTAVPSRTGTHGVLTRHSPLARTGTQCSAGAGSSPAAAPAPLRRCQHVHMRTHAKRTLNIVSNVSAARSTSPYIACDA